MFKKILFFILFTTFHFQINAQNTDWVLTHGDNQSEKGISIGTDSLGFIYISGFFNNDITFGSITLFASSGSSTNKDMFVAKLDSNGNYIWAISGGGGPFDDRALGMHVTPGGYVYLTGTFWGNITFAGVTANGNGHDTSLMAKIDPNGNCVWAKGFGAIPSGNCPWPIYDGDDHSYDVKVDDDDFIYVTGFFSGNSADFDGFTLNNPNWVNCQPSGYVGKMDSNGNFVWVERFDGIKDQRGSRDNRIEIDHFSNVYVVGGFENTGEYGPLTLTSNGEWDAFLFKMDKDGNWLWARNVGSNKSDRGNGIAIDACDNVYVSGEYRNPMVFTGANASNGTDTLSHSKKRDVFVAKITTNGDWVWAKRARSKGVDKPYQMSVDKDMQVFIAGSAGDSLKFNNNLVLTNGDTSINAYVAQLDGSGVGDWVWAKMGGGITDNDRAGDICEDGLGNVYAVGFYEGNADFEGNSLSAQGKKDVFVWKLSKQNVVPTPSNCIYVDVQPAGSGYLTMNGTDITEFPCLQNVSDSVNQDFVAVPYGGFGLLNWDWNIHTPTPSTTDPNSIVYTYTDDTLIINFNQIITDTIVYIVQPTGAGTITVDAGNITTFPNTSYYTEGNTSNLSATANAGFTFDSWDFDQNTPLPNATTNNITTTWSSNDTVYVNFNVIPTNDITYIVQPVGSGTITVDATNITAFPNTTNYVQGNTSNLSATPNIGFTFTSWDFDQNTPLPNATTNNITATWSSDDTVYVNFTAIPIYDITYIVNPVGAGEIEVNGTVLATNPTTSTYQQGTNLIIGANPLSSFTFKNWTNSTNTLNPNNNDPVVNFSVQASDTIIANFNVTDTLWVITKPTGVAQIEVAGDVITTSPYMGIYLKGSILDIAAYPYNQNIFDQWELAPTTLPDFNPQSSFLFLSQDTLFAYFNNVLAIEDIADEIGDFNLYPNIINNQFTIEMTSLEEIDLKIDLLNVNGQQIQTLYNKELNKGEALKERFTVDVSSGIYFVQLKTGTSQAVFKVIKL